MVDNTTKNITELVENLISENEVIVFSATYCHYCTKVKDLFTKLNINYLVFEVDTHESCQEIKDELFRRTNQKTIPNTFIFKAHIGGCDNVMEMYKNGKLFEYVEGKYKHIKYDLIVIGGGSGGIAAAKEAAMLKKKVALFNFVKASPHGSTWGVGGTCVNVGCIPKKFMHQAAIIGDAIEDSKSFGWNIDFDRKTHDWAKMVENIQNHIKKLNFNYLKYFKKNNIDYFNAFATFKNNHTIEATDKKGNVTEHSAFTFIIATGGRPHIPDFPGNNYPITSDDLFSLTNKPGKTLIIGGSYIALECAGFLHGLGINCTVMARSVLLRGFDQQIAEMIGSHMESIGIKIYKGFVPFEIIRGNWDNVDLELKFKVKMINVTSEVTEIKEEYYNLVMLATGRDPAVDGLGLDIIDVQKNSKSGKIVVDKYDQTSCSNVFAIGDVQDGHFELTPIAIKSGQQLVRRLYDNASQRLNYKLVPTTVFTPLEYGTCGLSEEEAIRIYGINIECYHRLFQPFEWILSNRNNNCYAKLICTKDSQRTVIGFHILGPNAGEITQGFALALKLKASKSDFDQLIGIHPTSAEVFTSLNVTRSDNPDPSAAQKDC